MAPLERLLAHLGWADSLVLGSLRIAMPLPARVLELYAHVLGAEEVWLARLQGRPARVAVWPTLTLDECERVGAETLAGLTAFVAGLRPDDRSGSVTYTNSAGREFTSNIEDILLHLALHGAYHRGQVALLLKAADREPAPSDYIAWARGAPTATRADADGQA